MRSGSRFPALLLAVYLLLWGILAVDPRDRLIWFYENLLVFVAVPAFAASHAWFAFSRRSYAAIFAFLSLHAVGAHYGYTQVPLPWEDWGFSRNHSDRVVHLAFGLLATLPVEEVLRRGARLGRGWREGLAVACVLGLAALFEVVEWLAVLVGGDTTGPTEAGYLGTQGDEFDAVKDIAAALVGAAATAGVLLASRIRRRAAAEASRAP